MVMAAVPAFHTVFPVRMDVVGRQEASQHDQTNQNTEKPLERFHSHIPFPLDRVFVSCYTFVESIIATLSYYPRIYLSPPIPIQMGGTNPIYF